MKLDDAATHLEALGNPTRLKIYRALIRAGSAGLAVGRGVRAIVLTNQKGAVLELSGRQSGLMLNVDLSGLALTLK